MTPSRLAEVATEAAAGGRLKLTVWDEVDIANENLGGLEGVARGSDEPARLIQLAWEPPKARARIALVGKGITFDSGGLSIKSAEGMETMKTDMSGAAAVLATMAALPDLAPDVAVLAIVPATENMPGGRATKPGDVLKARNGKTMEVLNTDAEGRLVLADALSLAVEAGVDAIVDLATLTGACMVALGPKIAGLMGTHDGWVDQVHDAADRAGEKVWPLPLPEEYRRSIDSDIADVKNIGSDRYGGALTAGLFLREFVGRLRTKGWNGLGRADAPGAGELVPAARFGEARQPRTLTWESESWRRPENQAVTNNGPRRPMPTTRQGRWSVVELRPTGQP